MILWGGSLLDTNRCEKMKVEVNLVDLSVPFAIPSYKDTKVAHKMCKRIARYVTVSFTKEPINFNIKIKDRSRAHNGGSLL